MSEADIREAEIIELLREIEAEVEDRWTLLRVKAAANTRRRAQRTHQASHATGMNAKTTRPETPSAP